MYVVTAKMKSKFVLPPETQAASRRPPPPPNMHYSRAMSTQCSLSNRTVFMVAMAMVNCPWDGLRTIPCQIPGCKALLGQLLGCQKATGQNAAVRNGTVRRFTEVGISQDLSMCVAEVRLNFSRWKFRNWPETGWPAVTQLDSEECANLKWGEYNVLKKASKSKAS